MNIIKSTNAPIGNNANSVIRNAGYYDASSPFLEWMQKIRFVENKQLYAITITYTDSTTAPIGDFVISQRVKRFYCWLLSNLVHRRYYQFPQFHHEQPLMILFSDDAGSKWKHSKPLPIRTNTCPHHHHGFIAIDNPRVERFEKFAADIQQKIGTGLLSGIQSIHIQLIDDNLTRWNSYQTAFDKRDFLVFPVSSKEMRSH